VGLFHEYVVNGNAAAINPGRIGTKAAAHLVRSVSPGGCLQLRACLRDTSESDPFETFDEVIMLGARQLTRSITSSKSIFPMTTLGSSNDRLSPA
jgi:hypothetical protein